VAREKAKMKEIYLEIVKFQSEFIIKLS